MRLTEKTKKQIQSMLKVMGLYSGWIDGDFGRKTTNAIKRFQVMHGLLPDGVVGKYTYAELFADTINGGREERTTSSLSLGYSAHTGIQYPHETEEELNEFYGEVGHHQKRVRLPYKMRLAWDLSKYISSMTVHEKVADDVQGIFEDVQKHYGIGEVRRLGLDLFGGSLAVRKIRGGTRHSTHSWGIAIDMNPAQNRLKYHKPKALFSRPEYTKYFDILEQHGAFSLGKHFDYDYMHFQFAWR